MKIGKYPVKLTYRIPRMIADVFSVGLAIFIFSVTGVFFDNREAMLLRLGEDTVAKVIEENPFFGWGHYLALVFPALVVVMFVLYIVLTLVNHKFSGYDVTKLTAQRCYDTYAFCVSLCKLPLLLGIFDVMYIVHSRYFGENVSVFSIQVLMDAVIIAIIIRYGQHRIKKLTTPTATADGADNSQTVKVRAVKSEGSQEEKK